MTLSCEQCRHDLWDHAYELLEKDQSQRLRDHLLSCPDCQKEWHKIQAEQRRIQRLVLVDYDIPPFLPPEDELETIPLRQSRGWRRIVGPAAVAAALLLAVGSLLAVNQHAVRTHSAELARARESLASVQKERNKFQQVMADERNEVLEAARSGRLRLQVSAPAMQTWGHLSPIHLAVTDLNGKPVDADWTARILAADERELYRAQGKGERGVLVVEIPPQLAAGDGLFLDVTATRANSRAHLKEPLRVELPELVSHLAVPKLLYQPGELVLFRSVTLERFRQTPAMPGLTIDYILRDTEGNVIQKARATTVEGGIGGGAFELPRQDAKEGTYTLSVLSPDGRFVEQTRQLEVHGIRPVRLKKELEFDRTWYKPGDTVRATLRAHRLRGGEAVASKCVGMQFGQMGCGKSCGRTVFPHDILLLEPHGFSAPSGLLVDVVVE